jgi:preprotein translocase subunit SecG
LIEYILYTIYIVSCFVLILFVLLQPGKSDAAAIFGGGASSTAFGPRGTQSVLARVTVTAAVLFFSIAFLFSIPGLFEKKSLGRGVGAPQPAAPAPAPVPTVAPATGASPGASPAGSPGTPTAPGAQPGKK